MWRSSKTDLPSFVLQKLDSSAPAVIEPLHPSLRELDSPLTIEGTFTATPCEFEDGMPHLNWVTSGQRIELEGADRL